MNDSTHTITLDEIITDSETKELRQHVKARDDSASIHSAVMAWANANPAVLERWKAAKLFPDYAGYLLEYWLHLR